MGGLQMEKAEQAKSELIDELIVQIRDLKVLVDSKRREELALEEGLDQFQTQYELYVSELEVRRYALEEQIQSVRNELEDLLHNSIELEDELNDDELPDSLAQENDDLDRQEFSYEAKEDDFEVNQTALMENSFVKEKQRVRRYFAHFWHPDTFASGDLMTQVNVAYKECEDVIDMLTNIPWHEDWVKRTERENIGTQWERLVEWKTHLDTALERIERKLAYLLQDWRYPLYADWQNSNAQRGFFADLANKHRKDLQSLEETLEILQKELSKAEQER